MATARYLPMPGHGSPKMDESDGMVHVDLPRQYCSTTSMLKYAGLSVSEWHRELISNCFQSYSTSLVVASQCVSVRLFLTSSGVPKLAKWT